MYRCCRYRQHRTHNTLPFKGARGRKRHGKERRAHPHRLVKTSRAIDFTDLHEIAAQILSLAIVPEPNPNDPRLIVRFTRAVKTKNISPSSISIPGCFYICQYTKIRCSVASVRNSCRVTPTRRVVPSRAVGCHRQSWERRIHGAPSRIDQRSSASRLPLPTDDCPRMICPGWRRGGEVRSTNRFARAVQRRT